MINNAENLHSHTLLSDGKMTHEETLDVAAANGCSIIAFTEHDLLMPISKYEELKKREHVTRWISGVELSVNMREGSDGKTGAHIIGLFIDPRNARLREHTALMQAARIKKVQDIASRFEKIGLKFDVDKCLSLATEGSVGKPHMVETLLSAPENLEIIEKYIDQFRIASASDKLLAEDYKEASERSKLYGIGQFVYPLFLRPTAFVPNVYTDFDASPDLAQAVEMIHGAGGVAILAHYHTTRRTVSLDLVQKLLLDKKLDGAEVMLGMKDPNKVLQPGEDEYPGLKRVVEEVGALASYSIDAHLKQDYEVFKRDNNFAEATIGATKKIIEQSGVSTEHSTLN